VQIDGFRNSICVYKLELTETRPPKTRQPAVPRTRECSWSHRNNEESAIANNLDALLARAKSIRQDILKMTTEAGSGHPSSSLSAVEIVTALYFDCILRHDPKNPHWHDRDRFILSKGHAAPVLYAALAQAGYFPHDEIMSLRKLGSPLEGHPNMKRLAGVEASTGSLGQGLTSIRASSSSMPM
jgi:transketolase N-terminal domain/subunit